MAGNPLTSAIVFVGGPIQHAINKPCFDEALKYLIKCVIVELEGAGMQVLSAHRAERFGAASHEFSPEFVTRRDYDWMLRCDLYVAILPVRDSAPYRSDGTHIEIGWAGAIRRPVLVIGNVALGEQYTHLVRGLGQLTATMTLDESEVRRDPSVVVDGALRLMQSAGSDRDSVPGASGEHDRDPQFAPAARGSEID